MLDFALLVISCVFCSAPGNEIAREKDKSKRRKMFWLALGALTFLPVSVAYSAEYPTPALDTIQESCIPVAESTTECDADGLRRAVDQVAEAYTLKMQAEENLRFTQKEMRAKELQFENDRLSLELKAAEGWKTTFLWVAGSLAVGLALGAVAGAAVF